MKMHDEHVAITVIVPIYQHWEAISPLFDALGGQTFPSNRWEFLLIDNGSDSVPDQKELPPFVKLLHCEKPGSYSARNVGLVHARGELIVFTDADCSPCSTWLDQLWNEFETGNGSTLIAGGVEVVKFDSEKPSYAELYDMAMGLSQSRYVKRGYAVTANLAVPKKVFSKVGAFDDGRFSGGDAEFCLRAGKYGYSLSYCESALVHHPARESWGDVVQKVRRVKGGKVTSGTYRKRINCIFRTYVPPVWAFLYVIKNKRFSLSQRMLLLLLQSRLWVVEMVEVARLVLGKTPERR